MATLQHFGEDMNPTPVGLPSLLEVVGALDENRAAHVILEPGDATRYELVLGAINGGGLVVTRVIGGRLVGSIVVPDDGLDPGAIAPLAAVEPLSNGNEWTAELMFWWITELCALMGSAGPAGATMATGGR